MRVSMMDKRIVVTRYLRVLSLVLFAMIALPLLAVAGEKEIFTKSDGILQLVGMGAIAVGAVKIKELKGLDAGIYHETISKELGVNAFLEEKYASEAGDDSSPYIGKSAFEVHLIRRSLKAAGKEVPLTALEKQLAVLGIKAFGPGSDRVEKFYSVGGQSTILFPAFISDRISVGLLLSAPTRDFVMAETVIDSLTYDKMTMTETEPKRQLKKTNEGAEFPRTKVTTGEQRVSLPKFGRILEASYEAIRKQRLDVFGRFLQRMGQQIGIDEFDELVTVLVNGDGNTGTAITSGRTLESATSGSIAVTDVIGWATVAASPYKLGRFVGKKALLQKYYNAIAGMNNPVDQFGFIGISLPKSYEWDRVLTALVADTFLGVDANYAVEMITDGPVLVESDKIISKQLNETVVSKRSAFSVFDASAIYRFDETHS